MTTLFTKIIQGEIPCYKILEDEAHLAFLDIRPIAQGHILVIPKTENDYIFDLEEAPLGALMAFAKKVARALEKAVPCARVGVMVAGLEVPHTHIHLIPIQKVTDLNFALATPAEDAALTRTAEKIRQAL